MEFTNEDLAKETVIIQKLRCSEKIKTKIQPKIKKEILN